MKIFNLKPFFTSLIAVFLVGCITTSLQAFIGSKDNFSPINLPTSITMDGEQFILKDKESFTAMYFLPNEGYGWSKKVDVLFGPKNNVKKFEAGIKKHQPKNVKYSFEYLNADQFKYYSIIPPEKDNPKFNFYEVTLSSAKNTKCGLIAISYTKVFGPETKESELMKYINDKMAIFLSTLPDISCK